jgi:hypothetical protein
VAVLFGADAATWRRRNAERDLPVPAAVLAAQLGRMPLAVGQIATEEWDAVVRPDPGPGETAHTAGAASQRAAPALRASRDESEARSPAQLEEVAITVLDVPVIGRDREHVAAIVERLRGRSSAAVFAQRHHAGVAASHVGRYRMLAERGIGTVFVSLPDLAGPDDLERLEPAVGAFA